MNNKIFNLKHAVCFLYCILLSPFSHAGFYQVWTPNNVMIDAGTINVTNSANNTIGYTTQASTSTSSINAQWKDICTNGDTIADHSTAQMKVTTSYPIVTTSGAYQYIKANSDYLYYSARAVYNGKVIYAPAEPFLTGDSNKVACGESHRATNPTEWHLSIYIAKPFIGSVDINEPVLYSEYIGGGGDSLTHVTYTVGFTGRVIVPQNCEVQPGNSFEIDLGQISQKAFVQGGAGNRPQGFTARPLTVKVSCAGGVQADALVNVRLEGAAAPGYPQALTSDNPGVGVVVTRADGTVLVPNDLNSTIPMQLQDSQGSVVIQSYPISLTGSAPAVGTFTTLANLRFDFS